LFRKILHNISILTTIFFAFLLILSDVSVFVNPEKIWIVPFFGLAFPYLLIINIAVVVYWLVKKRLTVIVPVLAILLSWNNLSAIVQIPIPSVFSKANKNAVELKVLTYNVRAFNRFKWNNSPNTNKDILKLIKQNNPDIICFQEFYKKEKGKMSITDILQVLKPMKYYYCFYSYVDQKPSNFGIAIFSKYPIVNKGKHSFKNTHNISMYCDITVNDETIRVYNNHLQSIKFIKGNYDFIDSLTLSYDERKVSQIKDISFRLHDAYVFRAHQVKKISAHIKSSPYKVIVCGDFNDTPVSYTYRKMRGSLKDAFRESGSGISNTYNGTFPAFRIDYILHSPQMRAYNYKVLKYNYSDHYSITCSIFLDKK
jgi:endonuclease/exonuclease/phosphatase family metal-dependent hydrolase